jgi:activating signal cointegrator complex subunit 1
MLLARTYNRIAITPLTKSIYFTSHRYIHPSHRLYHSFEMGKKKRTAEYNDFLDGEKLRDNAEIRTSLQQSPSSASTTTTTTTRPISPPPRKPAPSKAKPPALTHFLCIPLVTPATRPALFDGLARLRQDVEESGICAASAVRHVGSLHLTLGVMALSSASEVEDVKVFLAELDLRNLLREEEEEEVKGKQGLMIRLEGLHAMQHPGRTSVLYAKPMDANGGAEDRLMQFAQRVRRVFEEKGWVKREDRELKLHATVLNTIYARGKAEKGRKFDARELVGRWDGLEWAEGMRVDRVQVCRMGAVKVWSEGERKEVVDEEYGVVAEKMIGR